MFAILAEDISDVETLASLVRRMTDDPNVSIKGKGFSGGAELLKNGASYIKLLRQTFSCTRFIICHDADEKLPETRIAEIQLRIVRQADIGARYCAVVPKRSIESWILSDSQAIKKVFSGWQDPVEASDPEQLRDPKGHIERITRLSNGKSRYSNATHNQKIAQHINVNILARKCPSFRPLADFIRDGVGNCTPLI